MQSESHDNEQYCQDIQPPQVRHISTARSAGTPLHDWYSSKKIVKRKRAVRAEEEKMRSGMEDSEMRDKLESRMLYLIRVEV